MAADDSGLSAFLLSLETGPGPERTSYDLSLLRNLSDQERDVAGQALLALAKDGDQAAIETIADRIRGAGDVQSAFAAFDLKQVEGSAAVDGLLDALDHRSLSTRINGFDGLEARKPLPEAFRAVNMTPYRNLSVRLLVDMPAVWQPAARQLRTIWRHWLAGGSLHQLGLAYVPGDRELVDAFWASTCGDEPWDIAPVCEMAGHDRAWAETYALLRAGQRKRWAVDAIGRLELRHEREAIVQLKQASFALNDPDWQATLDRTIAAVA